MQTVTQINDHRQPAETSCLDSIFFTAKEGVLLLDDGLNILECNQVCAEMLGTEPAELVGRSVGAIIDDAACFQPYLLSVAAGLGASPRFSMGALDYRSRTGSRFPLETYVCQFTYREKLRLLVFFETPEASTRRADTQHAGFAETKLSFDSADTVGAVYAHELLQPLTAILVYLQAARRDGNGPKISSEDTMVFVDKALSEAQRASDIIRGIRELTSRQEPDRQSVRVEALVEEALQAFDAEMLGVGPQITVSIAENLPQLNVDPVQVNRILVNLLRNASEAVEGTEVSYIFLDVGRRRNAIEFRVSDTGVGVPSVLKAELFKAFVSSKQDGMGIGLALSRSLARGLGGDLTLAQTSTGRGATFVLKLPLKSNA